MAINLSNVDIGSGPGVGDGDPIRSAFNTVNQNFTILETNVNALTNSVTSVAGRTGNVTLTTQDIVGINNYANLTQVTTWITANVAALVDSAPDALNTLNEIAAAINDDANVYTTLVGTITSANTAMKGYVDNEISTLTSNASVQSGLIANLQSDVSTLTANAATQAGTLASLESNASVQSGLIAGLTANAGAQAGTLSTLSSNAAVQSGLIANLQSDVSTLTANAGAQAGSIATLTANAAVQAGLIANIVSYSNAAVASYLPTYSGNVKVDTVVFEDLSEQATAYTGQQFRTDLSGNGLTVKPAFLAYYPNLGTKPTLDTHFGFDSGGMWFNGNANDERAFPIRTNFHFHDTDVVEVIATINFATSGDDHGMAIFPVNTNPYWKFSTFAGRIQFNYNVGIPQLWGTANSSVAGGSVLSAGNYYTFKFSYDPTQSSVTVETFSGNTAVGSPLDTRSITENLNATEFVVGFDADQDHPSNRSRFTGLNIRTLTNGVFNDLEVTNDLTVDGNLSVAGYVVGNLTVDGDVTGDNLNIANWDTAYTWGDHSTEGYAVNVAIQGWTTDQITTANSAVVGYVDDAVSTANSAVVGYVDDQLTSYAVNVAIQGWTTNEINTANSAVVGYVDSLSHYEDSDVNTLLANWGSNTLSTTGNVAVGNIAVGDVNIGYVEARYVIPPSYNSGSVGSTARPFNEAYFGNFVDVTDPGATGTTRIDTGTVDIDGSASLTPRLGIGDVDIYNYGSSLRYKVGATANVFIIENDSVTVSGNISAQVNGYDIGYRDIPQVTAGNVTLALADRGKHYYSTSSAPLTLTVPSNANVAFPVGSAITIVNKGTANLTVDFEAEASMYLAGNATSASRTITTYGMATVMKTATDEWFINGTGVV